MWLSRRASPTPQGARAERQPHPFLWGQEKEHFCVWHLSPDFVGCLALRGSRRCILQCARKHLCYEARETRGNHDPNASNLDFINDSKMDYFGVDTCRTSSHLHGLEISLLWLFSSLRLASSLDFVCSGFSPTLGIFVSSPLQNLCSVWTFFSLTSLSVWWFSSLIFHLVIHAIGCLWGTPPFRFVVMRPCVLLAKARTILVAHLTWHDLGLVACIVDLETVAGMWMEL